MIERERDTVNGNELNDSPAFMDELKLSKGSFSSTNRRKSLIDEKGVSNRRTEKEVYHRRAETHRLARRETLRESFIEELQVAYNRRAGGFSPIRSEGSLSQMSERESLDNIS